MVRLDSAVRLLWVAGQGNHHAALQPFPVRAMRMPTGSAALRSPAWALIHTPCASWPQRCILAQPPGPCLSCAAGVLCPNLCLDLMAWFEVALSLCTCLGLWTVADPGCGHWTRSVPLGGCIPSWGLLPCRHPRSCLPVPCKAGFSVPSLTLPSTPAAASAVISPSLKSWSKKGEIIIVVFQMHSSS